MPAINRKQNYQKLRRAGYTSEEANLFKDYSAQYIEKLLNLQKLYREELKRLQLESGKIYHGKETSFD
jgi:DNA topoisomerase VI subunit A